MNCTRHGTCWPLLIVVAMLLSCTHDLDSVLLPCKPGECPTGHHCVSNRCVPGGTDASLDKATVDKPGADVSRDLARDLPGPDSPRDAAKVDVATKDMPAPDEGGPDAASPDARSPDAKKPDAKLPDAATPDAKLPDAKLPDATPLDQTPPDLPCACKISGQCYQAKQASTKYTCRVCDPGFAKSLWAPAPGCMITFAGSSKGYQDGDWNLARFSFPAGLAFDNNGALIVADQYNHCIRKVDQGKVSKVAGACGTKGPPRYGRFAFPADVLVDGANAIFVADKDNHMIRKIAGGTVTTYAGTNATTGGYVDGPALSKARFYRPTGLALHNNVMYVADSTKSTIRAVFSGKVSLEVGTLVGTGKKASGCKNNSTTIKVYYLLTTPLDMVVGNGDLFVVDKACANAVRKIDLTMQTIVTVAGSPGTFKGPTDLVRDSKGVICVADAGQHRVARVTGSGSSAKITTLVGKAGVGNAEGDLATQAKLDEPNGLVLRGDYLYVSDRNNHRIRVINLTPKGP